MNRKLTNVRAHVLAVAAVLVAFGAAACARRDVPLTSDAGTTAADVPARSRMTDDIPPPEPPRAAPTPPPPPVASSDADTTIVGAPTASGIVVEPPLAEWVPESGRLTVVHAPDLARNLGIPDASSTAEPVALPP